MGKIAIVGFHNLHLMQYLYKYTDIFDKYNIDYDVIFWDRDMDSTIKYKEFVGMPISYQYKMNNYQSKVKKIVGFLTCISFVKKRIKKSQYDKIIILTTQTAISLYRTVLKYRGNYIYDYRDLTYEKNRICKQMVLKLMNNSYMTCMSSMGFKQIIGDNSKIIISHNCSNIEYHKIKKSIGYKIRVTFWGMVRQVEFNKKICDRFAGDNRFDLRYHGEGYSLELQEYCNQKKYSNIKFTGRYVVDEIPAFVSTTDIILNLYENDEQQKLAITVKFYDAVRYGVPMLVTKGSFMEKILSGNKAVLAIDVDDINLDSIVEWYQKVESCKYLYTKELSQIKKDDKIFEERVLAFARK